MTVLASPRMLAACGWVSLARPWSPRNAPAGLYLQISGWLDLLKVGPEAPVVGMLGALSGLIRTATTDEHARRWFRRYWTFGVGSGAHILVSALLDSARRAAEGDRDG
jgi:hypothetical protein